MTDRLIVSKIIQALADYLKRDAASITEQHHLRDDLGLDSMAVIELLYKIEETFNIQIPDQDLTALRTVGSVAAYVEDRLAPVKVTHPRTVPKTAPKAKPKKAAVRSTSKPKKKNR
jgi:acyl carrier protein